MVSRLSLPTVRSFAPLRMKKNDDANSEIVCSVRRPAQSGKKWDGMATVPYARKDQYEVTNLILRFIQDDKYALLICKLQPKFRWGQVEPGKVLEAQIAEGVTGFLVKEVQQSAVAEVDARINLSYSALLNLFNKAL